MATEKKTPKKESENKDTKELKSELRDYVEELADKEVHNAVNKVEKKLSKQKNFIIIRRDILIIILLIIICGETYLLYKNDFFIKVSDTKTAEKQNETDKTDTEEQNTNTPETTEENLKEKYSELVENLALSINSEYSEEYYSGNLSDELKLYLTFASLSNEDMIKDEDYYYVDVETVEKVYNSLFDTEVNHKSFDFDGTKIKFLKAQNIYIFDTELPKSENTKKSIIDIQEKNDKLVIETVEALVEKEKIYNIETKKYVGEYSDDTSLEGNAKKLTNMKYTFVKNEDSEYVLDKLEKI